MLLWWLIFEGGFVRFFGKGGVGGIVCGKEGLRGERERNGKGAVGFERWTIGL